MHLMAVDGPRLVSLPSFRLEQDSDPCRNFEVFFDNRVSGVSVLPVKK